jgi:uncharacterized membrane protein YcaP (DUF421 family)
MNGVTIFYGGWEPILRIFVVGTLGYLALVLLIRLAGKRALAQMSAFDFVITVALGAAFGRILTARQVALAEAFTAFALLVTLQYSLAWIKVRSAAVSELLAASPVLLYFRGRFVDDAMRRERFTRGDIESAVRQDGSGGMDGVEAVVLEGNGSLSVIRKTRGRSGEELLDLPSS